MISRSVRQCFIFYWTALIPLTSSGLCFAQEQGTNTSNQSASQALTVTQNQAQQIIVAAVNAMGGESAWATVADSTTSGTCAPATQQGAQPAFNFRWIFAQHEFRFDAGAEGNSTVMLSGHGNPQAFDSDGNRSLSSESIALTRPFHLPGQVLAAALNDNRFRISLIGNEPLNGTSAVHAQIRHMLLHSDEPGSTQDWWFDPNSHLPLQVTFNFPGQEIQAYLPFTYSFLAWNSEGGLLVPGVIAESMYPNIPIQTCSISQLQINTQPSSGIFDAR